MSKKARDEALDRTGRFLFGIDWLGATPARQWRFAVASNGSLPRDAQGACRAARALHRREASGRQIEIVISWLQHAHKLDMTPSGFNSARFEAFARKYLPAVSTSPRAARRAAVRKIWESGDRPGSGGTVTWKAFAHRVRTECGVDYDLKTLQRDAAAMFLE